MSVMPAQTPFDAGMPSDSSSVLPNSKASSSRKRPKLSRSSPSSSASTSASTSTLLRDTLTQSPPTFVPRKKKNTGKSRSFLESFREMPLDILAEISSYLNPTNVLLLARTCKAGRFTLLSPGTKHIWGAALRNANVPLCPEGVSEIRYAVLLFDRTCQNCGGSPTFADYALRVRYCEPCRVKFIREGKSILSGGEFNYTRSTVLKLVPHSTRWMCHYSSHAYLPSQLLSVARSYNALLRDSSPLGAKKLSRFIRKQRLNHRNVLSHAKLLDEWERERALRKEEWEGVNGLRWVRWRKVLHARMEELGYTVEDYPPVTTGEWRRVWKEVRVITPDGWKEMRRKLERMMREDGARRADSRARRKPIS